MGLPWASGIAGAVSLSHMKKLFVAAICLVGVTLARADFTSYDVASQSDPLTFDPTTSFTSNTLTVNFDGNSGGDANFTADGNPSVLTLDFTDTGSILADNLELTYYFPDTSTQLIELTSSVPAFYNLGGVTIGVDADTVTVSNSTSGWTGGAFNGFVLTDLGPPAASAPDAAPSLLLLGAGISGLIGYRRNAAAAGR
jgi:hypothetical protein